MKRKVLLFMTLIITICFCITTISYAITNDKGRAAAMRSSRLY